MNKNKTQLNCHWLRWISYYQNAKQIHHQSLQALISMRNCEHPEKLSRNPPKKCQTSSSRNNWEKKMSPRTLPIWTALVLHPWMSRLASPRLRWGSAQPKRHGGWQRMCWHGEWRRKIWTPPLGMGIDKWWDYGWFVFFFLVFSPWIWALKDVSRQFFHAMNGVNLEVGWLGDRSLLTQIYPATSTLGLIFWW